MMGCISKLGVSCGRSNRKSSDLLDPPILLPTHADLLGDFGDIR